MKQQLKAFVAQPKNRLFLMVGAWIFGLLLVYQFSIQKYLRAADTKQQLTERKEQVEGLLHQIPDLDAALAQLRQAHPRSGSLTEKVTTFCEDNQLTITQFGETAAIQEGEQLIRYHELEMIGSFKPMLQLAYEIEHQDRQAYIPSAEWYLEKNRKSKQLELHGKLILQTISNE